jgi:hypothetical protein
MITDFLFDDKSALANMSLVCKAFHPSARLHLFETLTILIRSAQLSDLMEVFTSFAPLVHHLRINSSGINNSNFHVWTKAYLPVFKDVTSLTLENFSWDLEKTENGIKSNLPSSFSGLLELSFIFCTFYNMADIPWLALQFPHLERLHLEDVYVEDPPFTHGPLHVVPSDTCSLSSLRSVVLGGEQPHMPIINSILSLDTIPPLDNLQITNIVFHDFASVGQLLHALGPILRHLTLGFHQDTFHDDLGVLSVSYFAAAT